MTQVFNVFLNVWDQPTTNRPPAPDDNPTDLVRLFFPGTGFYLTQEAADQQAEVYSKAYPEKGKRLACIPVQVELDL